MGVKISLVGIACARSVPRRGETRKGLTGILPPVPAAPGQIHPPIRSKGHPLRLQQGPLHAGAEGVLPDGPVPGQDPVAGHGGIGAGGPWRIPRPGRPAGCPSSGRSGRRWPPCPWGFAGRSHTHVIIAHRPSPPRFFFSIPHFRSVQTSFRIKTRRRAEDRGRRSGAPDLFPGSSSPDMPRFSWAG